MKKILLSMLMLGVCFASAVPAFAQIAKNSDGFYEIHSEADYEEFRKMVATGNPYANAVLTANITVTDVIGKGEVQFHYRGTFDGQGHTIEMKNVKNDTQDKPWGLFQYTEPGCIIKNLKVTGILINENAGATLGAIVGEARGVRIENCISDAELNGKGYVGGLVGTCYGANFFENCAFIGELVNSGSEQYGIVGRTPHTISIKSCYVDAVFTSATCAPFMKEDNKDNCVFLNNYYRIRGVQNVKSTFSEAKEASTRIDNGKLCVDLNVKGCRGIVWYQNLKDHHPYPFFLGTDGQMVTVNGTQPCVAHRYENKVCTDCGALNESYSKVDPLQTVVDNGENGMYIDLLRYKLSSNNNVFTATVTGVKNNRVVNAIHIPETVRWNGNDFTVTKINGNTFGNSTDNKAAMQYCYIPQTVTRIENDAFNYCYSLTYLHIADAPSSPNLWMGENENAWPDRALFYDCPLKTVYIGRDVSWSSALNDPEPFNRKTDIHDVFFGPRLTIIGNTANRNDPREGSNYDLLNYCTGIRNVYLMGDEQNLQESVTDESKDLKNYCREGLAKATYYYINRSVRYSNYWEYSVGRYDDMGALDRCESVEYGPFVKYVTERSFCGTAANNNTTLQHVDFTNAVNLERIDFEAFNECSKASFTGLVGQYPLKSVGHDAFYNCDGLTAVNLGTKAESIGEQAFEDCSSLSYVTISGTVTSIGKEAFHDCKALLGVKFDDGETPIKYSQLKGRFDGSTEHISSVYLGRQIANPTSDSPFTESKKTLSSFEFGPYVNSLPFGLFEGLQAVRSLKFDYSPTPIQFEGTPEWTLHASSSDEDYNRISSLYIDRRIAKGNPSAGPGQYIDYKGDDWGCLLNTVQDLTFGQHITDIKDYAFTGFSKLEVLNLPSSLKTVGAGAFWNASRLKAAIFNGPTELSPGAFLNCENLETIVVADGGLKVGDQAFFNCDNIKEITINSKGDTPEDGSSVGFSKKAYAQASLYSTYDTSVETVSFSQYPWSLFQKHPLKRNKDYTVDRSEPSGIYEHASIPHTIKEGKYEFFYAPFQFDSYYFGSDAELYYIASINDTYFSDFPGIYNKNASADDKVTTLYVELYNADKQYRHTLPAGMYVVKTKHPDSFVHATKNLFLENDVAVDNTSQSLVGSFNQKTKLLFGGEAREVCPIEGSNLYVFEDEVLKLVNGPHQIESGSVVLENTESVDKSFFGAQYIENSKKDTLFASKLPVPFHGMLEGYATFYNKSYNVMAPEWCEVYVVTSVDGSVRMESVPDHIINAGQAVILLTKKDAFIGDKDLMTYVTNESSSADIYDRNLLKGVSENTPVEDICLADGFVYVLSRSSASSSTGFYKFSAGKVLGAGKAYLLPSDISGIDMAKSCLFTFGEETGVDDLKRTEGIGSSYDLSGRRVNAERAKGVYIVNSKKYIK